MQLNACDIVKALCDSSQSGVSGIVSLVRTSFVVAILMLFCITGAHAQETPDEAAPKGHYFLVVDHSGSMLRRIRSGPEQGRTRWDLMRERAEAFIGRLPEGSTVWVGVFSALDREQLDSVAGIEPLPLDGWLDTFAADLSAPQQRKQLMSQIATFPEPTAGAGTWLYQAIATALDRVEIVGARDPDAFMTVLVYTDGVDEGHGRTRAEMLQNPVSLLSRAELEARQKQLQDRHANLNIMNIYRPGDESILDAHVVRLYNNRVRLPSPIVEPEQKIELGLYFRDDEAIQLEGRPLTLQWQVDPGDDPPPLRIEGGPFQMINGELEVDLVLDGDWPVGRDVEAKLQVVYPKIEDIFLTEEGGSVIDIVFQGANAPTISDLTPKTGSSFPLGRQIGFSLTTLPGCDVEWIFDDGTLKRGNSVTHEFDAPGERSVMARVTDPRTGLTETAISTFSITELEVSLDPLPVNVIPGEEISLSASAKGDFRSFEWLIGGRSYTGLPRQDGRPGSRLTLSFERPGEIPIQVLGRGVQGGIAESTSATLRVNAVPTLRVPSPTQGESLYFGAPREFRAEIEGIEANQVRFVLSVGEEELFSRNVDVRTEGTVRLALLPIEIPTLARRAEARLQVSTVGVNPSLSREVILMMESEPASITITLPEGREPHINRETPIQLEANAEIDNIRWNFGQGWVDGTAVMRHAWKNYGNFQVQAEATGPDGSRLIATPVDVAVPVRRIKASGRLLYKERTIGSEVTKVPRRSTVQLVDESVGDVLDSRWSVNGVELPYGQSTLITEKPGAYEVKLTAIGTSEAGRDEAVIVFQTNDRFLFWVYTMVLLLITALFGRLLLGNKWRHAEFGIQRRARPDHDPGRPEQRRELGRRGGVGSWDFWKKSARISLQELDGDVCPRWEPRDRLEFKRDLSLLFAKGSPNRDKCRINPTDHLSLRDPYERRWTIVRPLNRDDDDSKGAIFLKLRSHINPFHRWWPELTFLLVVCVSFYVLRYLTQTLY